MPDTKSTQATVERHLQAVGEGIDSLLSDYTAESVTITPDANIPGIG